MRSARTDKKAAPEVDAAVLRRALAQAGWRYTRQREAVYRYLCSAQDHPTAEQIYHTVRRQIPSVSLATIYKALEALVDARLATKIPDASGPARFDWRAEPHYHFRCMKTGQVIDLPIPFDSSLLDKLDANLMEALRRQGFRVTGHHLEIVGHYERN